MAVPLVGKMTPESSLSVVVLPAPLGPRKADEFALFNRQIDSADRFDLPVYCGGTSRGRRPEPFLLLIDSIALREPGDLDGGHGRIIRPGKPGKGARRLLKRSRHFAAILKLREFRPITQSQSPFSTGCSARIGRSMGADSKPKPRDGDPLGLLGLERAWRSCIDPDATRELVRAKRGEAQIFEFRMSAPIPPTLFLPPPNATASPERQPMPLPDSRPIVRGLGWRTAKLAFLGSLLMWAAPAAGRLVAIRLDCSRALTPVGPRPKLAGRRPYLVLWLAGFAFWLGILHWLRLPHPETSIGWVGGFVLSGFLYPRVYWFGSCRRPPAWALDRPGSAPGLDRGGIGQGATAERLYDGQPVALASAGWR